MDPLAANTCCDEHVVTSKGHQNRRGHKSGTTRVYERRRLLRNLKTCKSKHYVSRPRCSQIENQFHGLPNRDRCDGTPVIFRVAFCAVSLDVHGVDLYKRILLEIETLQCTV